MPVQCGRPCAKFTAWITPEIFHTHLTKVYFRERHGTSVQSRFRFAVHSIYKNAHLLFTRTVGVDRSSSFPSRFYFDSLTASFYGVIRVNAPHNEIRVSVEICIFCQYSRVLAQAGCQHVGQNAGHDGRPQHIVETLQSLADQIGVNVKREVVYILDGGLKITNPKLIGKRGRRIELCPVHDVSADWHSRPTLYRLEVWLPFSPSLL